MKFAKLALFASLLFSQGAFAATNLMNLPGNCQFPDAIKATYTVGSFGIPAFLIQTRQTPTDSYSAGTMFYDNTSLKSFGVLSRCTKDPEDPLAAKTQRATFKVVVKNYFSGNNDHIGFMLRASPYNKVSPINYVDIVPAYNGIGGIFAGSQFKRTTGQPFQGFALEYFSHGYIYRTLDTNHVANVMRDDTPYHVELHAKSDAGAMWVQPDNGYGAPVYGQYLYGGRWMPVLPGKLSPAQHGLGIFMMCHQNQCDNGASIELTGIKVTWF